MSESETVELFFVTCSAWIPEEGRVVRLFLTGEATNLFLADAYVDAGEVEFVTTETLQEAWYSESREDAEAFCAEANADDFYRACRSWAVGTATMLLEPKSRRRFSDG